MGRPKKETITITITLTPKVKETLEADAEVYGLGKAAYISQLIMQKHIERISTGLMEQLTPEQFQEAIKKQMTFGDLMS